MKKYLGWMTLCVFVIFAKAEARDSLEFSDFSVKISPEQRLQVFNKTRQETVLEYTMAHTPGCGEYFLAQGDFNQDGGDDFAALCASRCATRDWDAENAPPLCSEITNVVFLYDRRARRFSAHELLANMTAVGDFYIAQASDKAGRRKIYVFKKSSKRLIQTLDAENYEIVEWPEEFVSTGDYNFDGLTDFSIFGNSFASANQSSVYFWYNPEKGRFDEGIEGLSWSFDYENKIITSTNQCCAGSQLQETRFAVRKNQLVELGTRCSAMDIDLWQAEEKIAWLEHDCDSEIQVFPLASAGSRNNFQVSLKILDKNRTKGVALYSGQKEYLDLRLKRRFGKTWVYDELYQGKVTGEITLNLNNESDNAVLSAHYVRKKDGKKFDLIPASPTADP